MPFLGPRPLPDPPRRPNPSGSSPGGDRWFGISLAITAGVMLGVAYLGTRAQDAERDARVSDTATDFATEACTP